MPRLVIVSAELTLGRAQRVLVQVPAAPGLGEDPEVSRTVPKLLEPPRVTAGAQPSTCRAGVHPHALGELAHGEPSVAFHAAV